MVAMYTPYNIIDPLINHRNLKAIIRVFCSVKVLEVIIICASILRKADKLHVVKQLGFTVDYA